MAEEQKYEIIEVDAIVDIKVSTGYYQKINEIHKYFTKDKSKKEMQEAYNQIAAKEITEDWCNEDGELVLHDGEDCFGELFWSKYEFVFDEKILKEGEK